MGRCQEVVGRVLWSWGEHITMCEEAKQEKGLALQVNTKY